MVSAEIVIVLVIVIYYLMVLSTGIVKVIV